MLNNNQFTFEISLSVLNHLGRNLYRSFATVLGEAISNSWDADAENVWIFVDKNTNSLCVKDDGLGMTAEDFQGKFLKIGYSKRKAGKTSSAKGRPYIGRKGIGKLALLSCADKIHVISKTTGGALVGGIIDNSGLDQAITDDLSPKDYPLKDLDTKLFDQYTANFDHGTIIYFEGIKDGIKNSLDFLKKTIALYFRFSLLDNSFKIFLGNDEITYECLSDLAQKTEFLWQINKYSDPYVSDVESRFKPDINEKKQLGIGGNIHGFIASVEKPRDLKIMATEERVGVDLFVNGRIRERDILRHIPTARVAESYLYGQIHFNDLDDSVDRFTSSRESIVADDPKYKELLDILRNRVINEIIKDWDIWRRKHREDGDPEDQSISTKERKAEELYNAVSEEYDLPKESVNRKETDSWVGELAEDARYNITSYAECFIAENLIRKFIQEKAIPLSTEAGLKVANWKKVETESKNKGNISIDIRKVSLDISYLSMHDLACLVDNKDPIKEACLARDANEYKPVRDAIAHTALLTDIAKQKLTSVYENIKGRIRTLLADSEVTP